MSVPEFERAFADIIKSKFAIAVNSGTSALHSALVAIDVKGKEVIMPALCPAMDAFAIIHAGGIPVFADVDPQTHLVTDKTIAQKVTTRTQAIIAVALHGLPCDMDPIMRLANSWGAYVIEDSAQALLARYKEGHAGTKADLGCFSFEQKKHMTTGSEGGMIVTNNPILAERARKFAGIGYKHMTAEAGRTSLSASIYQRPDYARFDTIGLNYRMSMVQAAVGMVALNRLSENVMRRQMIGYLWQEALGCQLQPHPYEADNVFYSAAWEYPGEDWIGFYEEFCKRGGDGFYAMPLLPWKEPAIAHSEHSQIFPDCPVAEKLQKKLMLFKTHYFDLEEAKKQTAILKAINAH